MPVWVVRNANVVLHRRRAAAALNVAAQLITPRWVDDG